MIEILPLRDEPPGPEEAMYLNAPRSKGTVRVTPFLSVLKLADRLIPVPMIVELLDVGA